MTKHLKPCDWFNPTWRGPFVTHAGERARIAGTYCLPSGETLLAVWVLRANGQVSVLDYLTTGRRPDTPAGSPIAGSDLLCAEEIDVPDDVARAGCAEDPVPTQSAGTSPGKPTLDVETLQWVASDLEASAEWARRQDRGESGNLLAWAAAWGTKAEVYARKATSCGPQPAPTSERDAAPEPTLAQCPEPLAALSGVSVGDMTADQVLRALLATLVCMDAPRIEGEESMLSDLPSADEDESFILEGLGQLVDRGLKVLGYTPKQYATRRGAEMDMYGAFTVRREGMDKSLAKFLSAG